ncbi:TRAP transporter small permease [Kushneria indalinina]|uniref:TRAP transporter small permease protein n=1 Tax=Kushneria indalinina DSM 14324 TaxID=1122140 RepID=A0A3D9E091_9GAMM|nr:TRAP transporter small permease [Kushneria indalinina]REC96472.1 TRAP-type C4-dicarboxylate transport system permease small subunit [Kushneria indalinina DSM 14324]
MPFSQGFFLALNRVSSFLDRLLGIMLICLFFLLVLVVTVQVGSRYLTDSPTTATDEMARFALIWLGLMGAAYASGRMRHLSIDLLPDALPWPTRRWLLFFLQLLVLFFAGYIMLYGGGSLVMTTLSTEQTTPMLGWHMGWIYLALPLSGAFIVFHACLQMLRLAGSKDAPNQHKEDDTSW